MIDKITDNDIQKYFGHGIGDLIVYIKDDCVISCRFGEMPKAIATRSEAVKFIENREGRKAAT